MSEVATTFSVIVSTMDRAEPLRTLLRSLEGQSYSRFEVITVVGPTRDHTLSVLDEYAGRVSVVRCPEANLSHSRNVGLLEARGDVAAFIDDDAVPSRRWLEQLARLFADDDLDATGGTVYCIHPELPVVQHRLGVISSLGEQVDVRSSRTESMPPGEGRLFLARMMGTNMAFRRRVLLGIGGFDEFFEWVYDDTDAALRLACSGGVIEPVKEAVVYHVPASSRNREVFTWNFRSWVQTKSMLYFMIKHGRAAGDPLRTIAYRCLRFVHGRWILGGLLRDEGKLGRLASWRMRAMEMFAAVNGSLRGSFTARRVIPRATAEASIRRSEPIRPFPDARSPFQPSVDPLSGHRPRVTIVDPPLRVCLLSTAYPPFQVEGVGRHTSLIARGLAARGHMVHVVTRGEREQVSWRDGAYVHRIAARRDRYLPLQDQADLFQILNHSHAVYEKVRRLALNDGVQLVDTPLWNGDGLVTLQSGTLPVVVRVQTANRQVAQIQKVHRAEIQLIGALEQSLLERADFLIANSQATVDTLRRVYGIHDPARTGVVPHGIEPVRDTEVPAGGASGQPIVLFVGRLEERKGIRDLLSAIPRVLRRHPHARFVLAGADNSHNDGFQRRMGLDYPSWFAREHPDLRRAVTFEGAVDDARLNELYRSCELFVAPSLYESFGLIYLEAMNYAKPVIGCRAGGIPEVVEHGVTGVLVDPGAPAELAEAVSDLIASPGRGRELGRAGRARLLERFGFDAMAREFESIYRAVLAARGASRGDAGATGSAA